MGPATRLLLAESGLSVDSIDPSGPNGIITKGDVLQAMQSGTKPSSSGQKQEVSSRDFFVAVTEMLTGVLSCLLVCGMWGVLCCWRCQELCSFT